MKHIWTYKSIWMYRKGLFNLANKMGLLWKSKASPCGNRSTAKNSTWKQKVCIHACITALLLKITTLPAKNFKKRQLHYICISNFKLSLMVNSHFFQMFTPASFVPTVIFPSVARTTPSSTECPAPFHHFFVASTAGRTTTLYGPTFSFVRTTQNSFRSKSNLNAMHSRVSFFLSVLSCLGLVSNCATKQQTNFQK